jgi:hypothetical protein
MGLTSPSGAAGCGAGCLPGGANNGTSSSNYPFDAALSLSDEMVLWANALESNAAGTPATEEEKKGEEKKYNALSQQPDRSEVSDYWVACLSRLRLCGMRVGILLSAHVRVEDCNRAGYEAHTLAMSLYRAIDWSRGSRPSISTPVSAIDLDLLSMADGVASPADTDANLLSKHRWLAVAQYLWTGNFSIKEIEQAFNSRRLGSRKSSLDEEACKYLSELSRKEFAYLLAVDRHREREKGATCVGAGATNGATAALGSAAPSSSSFPASRRLSRLDRVALWDRPDPYGRTPLWWACFQDHPIIAKVRIAAASQTPPRTHLVPILTLSADHDISPNLLRHLDFALAYCHHLVAHYPPLLPLNQGATGERMQCLARRQNVS